MNCSLLINVASLVTSSYGLIKCTHIQLPQSLAQAGQKQFLTNISLAVTICHNVVTIALHVVKHVEGCRLQRERRKKAFARATATVEQTQLLKKGGSSTDSDEQPVNSTLALINRHVTLPLALVLESVVATVYWPLRLFAIRLILQGAKAESPIPLRIDISIHLLPILYMLGDYYLSGASEPLKIYLSHAWVVIAGIGLAYKVYLNALIDTSSGQRYPYPFLDVSEPYKSIIFVMVTSVGWLFYVFYRSFPPKDRINKRRDRKLD